MKSVAIILKTISNQGINSESSRTTSSTRGFKTDHLTVVKEEQFVIEQLLPILSNFGIIFLKKNFSRISTFEGQKESQLPPKMREKK